jgi:hypothetical protein
MRYLMPITNRKIERIITCIKAKQEVAYHKNDDKLIEFLKRELKKSYHFNYLNRKNENKNFKS